MFKKSDFLTLGKGYDVSRTSLIILDNKFYIQYANSYAKALLSWEHDNTWINRPFNEMCQFLDLPVLITGNKLTSSEPVIIKDYIKVWELSPVLVDTEKYFFLLDKDVTQQQEIYIASENSLQEVTGQNFTYKLSAQEYIDEIRNHLEGIILQMPGYVFWKDRNFKYLFCNEATSREILGFDSPKEIIGKTDYDFGWDHDLVDEYRKVDEEIIRTGKPKLGFREELIREDGKIFQLLVNKMPLINNSGDIIGIIGITIDITAEKAAQQAELEAHIKFRKLVDQMAHDIGSPLMALNVLANSCLNIPEDERIMLIEAISKINDIANSLLREYRVKESDMVTENELLELLVSTTLEQSVMDKKYEYQNLPIKFKYICNPGSHFCFIQANAIAFKRMISNLLNNAVDALEGKFGQVSLELKSNAVEVKILISDNGKGMPQEVIDKILNNAGVTFGKEQGHGIGFTQVRDALANNEGNLAIKSRVGVGTKIILTFPKIETPKWIAEKIELSIDDLIVILDDDSSIHGAWETRFEKDVSKIKRQHFNQGKKVIEFINSLTDEEKDKVLLLTDYELLKQELHGLDVINKTKVKRSILVTSHHNSLKVRDLIKLTNTKILPKSLASEVPISVVKA